MAPEVEAHQTAVVVELLKVLYLQGLTTTELYDLVDEAVKAAWEQSNG